MLASNLRLALVASKSRVALLVGLIAACTDVGAADERGDSAVRRGDKGGSASADDATSAGAAGAVSLEAPAPVTIDEEEEAVVVAPSSGIHRFDADGLPPGARFDGATGTVTFRPDFTQSGSYSIAVTGYGGGRPASFKKTVQLTITVRDSIAPPAPVIASETTGNGFKRLVVRQTSDAFLDSPGHAGRTFDAIVVVPSSATKAAPAPVEVVLHGFAAGPNNAAASTTSFRIEPHDPDNTYWWGYGDTLPGGAPTQGYVNGYTTRRVLHLVDWLLRTHPEADADRVFSTGVSMGGAGALTLGFLHARHFAGIEATIGQAIPRNHRPSRIDQLSTLWGTPEANLHDVWNQLDITRMLRDSSEAKNQFVFTKHGKDDSTIHFGAAVTPSPLTKTSFYGALEEGRIGHLTVWDEGAHGPADPVLGDGWWDSGWSRISDPTSYLTRRAPFPAFTRSSANEAPGDGSGNGKRPFDAEKGYSGKLEVAGDTGWSGAIAGAFNRFLRWDTRAIVETHEKLALPLRVVTSSGDPSPKAGYPTKRDRYDGPLPILADVTPRRTSAFRLVPGERVRYRFGSATGTAVADADGSVTVPSLPITTTQTVLELERDTP